MSRRKVLLLAGLAAMVLLAVIGCSLLVRDETGVPAGSGWYIQTAGSRPRRPQKGSRSPTSM